MSVAEQLVKKGTSFAYFRFRRNAEEFARLWKQRGRRCSPIELTTRGYIIDPPADVEHPETPYTKQAYLCVCYTKAEDKKHREWDRLIRMAEKQPKKYWQHQLRTGIMKHIDPEVRELVRELNNRGFYTVESCAGHPGEYGRDPERNKGRIFFKQDNIDYREVRAILVKYGLTGLKREKNTGGIRGYYYEFDPIGKPRRRG